PERAIDLTGDTRCSDAEPIAGEAAIEITELAALPRPHRFCGIRLAVEVVLRVTGIVHAPGRDAHAVDRGCPRGAHEPVEVLECNRQLRIAVVEAEHGRARIDVLESEIVKR